jgi:prepilin-type N-terminal cleavage/methylation domain-containing protein
MIHRNNPPTTQSSQSGFTIIESLVAMIVVAILLTAIAPVIVLSVATRIQAKRIETAADAAKRYIEGVRSGAITVPPSTTVGANTYTLNSYPAPALGTLTCTANNYCTTPSANLYCIDLDGSGCSLTSAQDLVIQAFRYNQGTVSSGGTTTNIVDPTMGYQLGVRVYRASGFSGNSGNLQQAPYKQNTFTGGLGNASIPLVEMTTAIDTGFVFSNLCTRLQQTNAQSTCSSNPTN